MGVGDDESGGGSFFYKVSRARLPLDILTGPGRGLRCMEEGSGVGVGSTTSGALWRGVALTTVRAVVVVGLRCKSRVTSWLLISILGY